ncbi:MAG: hypothetical protein AAF662_01395 [Pseudomonadota bacterium]
MVLRINESEHRNIDGFALAWRWTQDSHARFGESELASLVALSPQKAESLRSELGDTPIELHSSLQTGGKQPSSVTDWLFSRLGNADDSLVISWSDSLANIAPAAVFAHRWDDFCYPSSDDVLVSAESQAWVLKYHHWEEFEWGIARDA